MPGRSASFADCREAWATSSTGKRDGKCAAVPPGWPVLSYVPLRSIAELPAPDYRAGASGDILRQRAEEKERNRALPGTIKRMQFTFNLDSPAPTAAAAASRPAAVDPPRSLRFPSLFTSDFGPSALLDPAPSLTTPVNYGEGLSPAGSHDAFSIPRPTIELPLDELLDAPDTLDPWHLSAAAATPTPVYAAPLAPESDRESSPDSDDEDSDFDLSARAARPAHKSAKTSRKRALPQTVAPAKLNPLYDTRASTPTARPALTVRTSAVSRPAGPGATSSVLRSSLANSGPGGQKAECSNCGATHTPLWRRGLNDELNCNACGLYCKLHKRPRPKSMRNTHGERAQAPPRQETVDVMGSSSSVPPVPPRSSSPVHRLAQCYNCHTTATPLWRKDDEGKTVCNACGLYYKLHGSARPISMKSDVIRKRSRHDARRGANSVSDTPSASPGVSRRASLSREASPTLAPDSTTQMSYEYTDELDFRSTTHSELLGALGQDLGPAHIFQYNMYPGPYHPDYLSQAYTAPNDPLPFAPDGSAEQDSGAEREREREEEQEDDPAMSPRTSKRRRMSTDSASEPPSSASYSSYNDGYTTSSSATSLSAHSMEFPFSSAASSMHAHTHSLPHAHTHAHSHSLSHAHLGAQHAQYFTPGGPALRGSGNTFWHPPMMPQGECDSPHVVHPPMLPALSSPPSASASVSASASGIGIGAGAGTGEESPMDYLHQPLGGADEELFSTFLHPPMAIPDEFAQALSTVHPPMVMDYHHDLFDAMRVY
ncbi:hypothetical protein C0992_002785 [Termitomyces sp. T32_za158]|nr:hypothetical protein C0992_002785 [Termitomyces sp. T32_za158]